MFLEQLDRKNRENNLVLFGIPNEALALDGATTDDAKIQKVLETVEANAEHVIRSHHRTGVVGPDTPGTRHHPVLGS